MLGDDIRNVMEFEQEPGQACRTRQDIHMAHFGPFALPIISLDEPITLEISHHEPEESHKACNQWYLKAGLWHIGKNLVQRFIPAFLRTNFNPQTSDSHVGLHHQHGHIVEPRNSLGVLLNEDAIARILAVGVPCCGEENAH